MVDIDQNLRSFTERRGAEHRYASFDYCFNYFQWFRDHDQIRHISDPENLQTSCLQLGFYLASWGMMRGSTVLLQKSCVALVPVVKAISRIPAADWDLDAHMYNNHASRVITLKNEIAHALKPVGTTETLATKVVLGVFGCLPAFDTQFKSGFKQYCHRAGIHSSSCNETGLRKLGSFYQANQASIDAWSTLICTMDFSTQSPSPRHYPRAKIIDMIFFVEGGR